MTEAMDAFFGVVPSAGASRRMGRPKALLTLGGSSFVRRAVDALREGGCPEVVVVVAAGDRPVGDEASAAGARVLENPHPGEGPITSLRLAIEDLGEDVDGIVCLPVDHPLVRSDTVRILLDEARASGAALTLPMHGAKRGHPAIFRRVLFAELLDPSLRGGARAVVHRHLEEAAVIQVDDPGVIADIDTPDAYDAIASTRATTGRDGGASR